MVNAQISEQIGKILSVHKLVDGQGRKYYEQILGENAKDLSASELGRLIAELANGVDERGSVLANNEEQK